MEFLRRVVNELNGRRFEYTEEMMREGDHRDFVSAQVKADDLLHVLPEVTRKFAAEIRQEFLRCHNLLPPPGAFGQSHYTARDPISGVSIRGLRHWHVMLGDVVYRFDAAFS